jgi:hypothetical protein
MKVRLELLINLELEFEKSEISGDPLTIMHFNDVYNIQEM